MRLLALMAAASLTACSHEPRTQPPAPVPPAAALPSVVTPPPALPTGLPDAQSIDWQGDPGFASPHSGSVTLMGQDSDIVFEPDRKNDSKSKISRVDAKVVRWSHPLPDLFVPDAALLVAGDTVFVAHYIAISDGATVHALDLATGQERWATLVHGLGGVGHSKYANHVTLKLIRGGLVVFGNESGGRYIEVFDPATGKMTSTRTLPLPRT